MKRSKMVELLLEYDDELLPMQAEDIIKFLESKGMQPPEYQKMVSIEKLAPGKELWSNETFFKWEPEDEKK